MYLDPQERNSGPCQLQSYGLSPNLPFHTLLGDAGTGTVWMTFLLCQLAPSQVQWGRWRGSGHTLSCFAFCRSKSQQWPFASGFQLFSRLLEPVSLFSLQRPRWAAPPPQRSELQLLRSGWRGASTHLPSNNPMSCFPLPLWGGNCFLMLLSLLPQASAFCVFSSPILI